MRYQQFSMSGSNMKKLEDEEAPHFSTKLGLICSCLGCVVGTGNIWRFPRIVANNSNEEGGLVFLIVWVVFLFLWSSPMLLIEYGTGRFTKKAVIGSFREIIGEKAAWCGAWISLVTFAISCYYSVVLGWCFYYFIYCIGHELPATEADSRQIFRDYAEESNWPVLTHFIALTICGLAVTKGVKTFEKVNMFLVPVLLLIILFTFIWALTREYADYGIKFMFTPSWKSFGEPRLWVDAISQNAFDTGAGMGLMIPYSSFMNKNHGIVKYGYLIPATNNLVSLICGMLILSTVFSTLILTGLPYSHEEIVNILKDSGPASTGLTFVWIPVLFESIGGFGRALSILFFLCLSFAGITSLISNMELMTHTLHDFGLSRKFAMPLTVVLTFAVGLMSALDIDILTNQDFVWGFALLINGMMLQSLVISYGSAKFRKELYNEYSTDDWTLPKVWEWMVKYLAPLEAIAIIVWWAIDLIDDESSLEERWYEFGRETFMVTIVQWLGLMLLLITINTVYWFYRRRRMTDEEVKLLVTSTSVHTSGTWKSYETKGATESLENSDIVVKDIRL